MVSGLGYGVENTSTSPQTSALPTECLPICTESDRQVCCGNLTQADFFHFAHSSSQLAVKSQLAKKRSVPQAADACRTGQPIHQSLASAELPCVLSWLACILVLSYLNQDLQAVATRCKLGRPITTHLSSVQLGESPPRPPFPPLRTLLGIPCPTFALNRYAKCQKPNTKTQAHPAPKLFTFFLLLRHSNGSSVLLLSHEFSRINSFFAHNWFNSPSWWMMQLGSPFQATTALTPLQMSRRLP